MSRIDEPRCAWKNSDFASLQGRTKGDRFCDCDDDDGGGGGGGDDDDCGGVSFSSSIGDENSACSIRKILFNSGDVCIISPHEGERCWNLGLSNDNVVVLSVDDDDGGGGGGVATVRRDSS